MDQRHVELFVLKCAVIESGLRSALAEYNDSLVSVADDLIGERLNSYIKQFELKNRTNAAKMARYYQIFYMLENDIRRLIEETLESSHGVDWWDKCASVGVKEEVKKNRTREAQAGLTLRSEDELDYTTFGQLGDLIRDNWDNFAGMLSNPSAVSRTLSSLNMLRGTIAHCGVLAEDEVDRLELATRDWFRVLEGPKA